VAAGPVAPQTGGLDWRPFASLWLSVFGGLVFLSLIAWKRGNVVQAFWAGAPFIVSAWSLAAFLWVGYLAKKEQAGS
jgi:hypothetical protein